MPIRSLSELPTFFVPAVSSDLAERAGEAHPLEVYEITYLHYHAVLEVALCTEGSGVCVDQSPKAGERVSPGTEVRVTFD